MDTKHAAATIQGRHHALAGRNAQDAFATGAFGDTFAAVVCDGCGSEAHSEAGALFGARIVVDELLRCGGDLRVARAGTLERLRRVAEAVGSTEGWALFTVVGLLICEGEAQLFSCGDGLFALNGEVHVLEAPDNAPPYLAYGDVPFTLHRRIDAAEVRTVALGTDGAGPLAGELQTLFDDELVWRNPDGLRRRLAQRRALFADDATLVLVRRA